MGQDNAPAHKSKQVTAFLQKKLPGRVVSWPPRSPDLNIIENAWGEWKRRVAMKRPRDAAHMERLAISEWATLTADRGYVSKLFGSMEKRLRMVVEAKGGFLPY